MPLLSTISTSSPMSTTQQRFCTQVATDNSSSFIKFPINSRQSSSFTPSYRPRTSLPSTRSYSRTTDSQSISTTPNSSNSPALSITSNDHKRNHSQQKCNPILYNSLLNHRKGQLKSYPMNIFTDFSYTTKLCLSSKPFETISNDNEILIISEDTLPSLSHQIENDSDQQIILNNNEQEIKYLDENKYNYITYWLNEVQQSIHSNETFSKNKRSKKRFVRS